LIHPAVMLFAMLVAHWVVDAHQGGISPAKRHDHAGVRWSALILHGSMHAFPVAVITGSLALGAAELIAHALIDRCKGRGWIGTWTDQALHVACKVAWVALA
jgi:hypothetical protein